MSGIGDLEVVVMTPGKSPMKTRLKNGYDTRSKTSPLSNLTGPITPKQAQAWVDIEGVTTREQRRNSTLVRSLQQFYSDSSSQ